MVPHVLVQTPGTITSGQHSGTVDDNGLRRRGDAQGPGLLQYKIGVGARAGHENRAGGSRGRRREAHSTWYSRSDSPIGRRR